MNSDPRNKHDDPEPFLSRTEATAFLGLILAGDALSRALDRGLREHGMSLHEFEVLLVLSFFSDDGTMPMLEIRRQSPLSQSRVSRVVSALDEQGLVTRRSDPDDSRAVIVAITQQGREVFEANKPHHKRDLERHLFSLLTPAELEQLASITDKLLDARQNKDS